MKKLILGIGFSFLFFSMDAQIGLQTGNQLLLVAKIAIQQIPKIDFFIKENDEAIPANLEPTWSFSESNVYDAHFGFFCKVEVKLDKVAKVPMRFRLGSVDYVNGLEGK